MARRAAIDYHSSLPIEPTNEWMRDTLNEFKTDKPDFIAFSPKYVDPYETDLETKIETAKNVIPDSVHLDILTGLTATLEAKMDTARIEEQKLFRFVADVFPNNPAKINEAGKNDYEAARKNYEKMLTLLKISKKFADENAAALLAKGYTAAMALNLATSRTELEDALIAQNKAQKVRAVDTENRRITVNIAYDAVRDLCEDAKIIYVSDYAMYNKYLLPGVDSGSIVTGTVLALKTKNVLHRAFTEESKLLIKNLEAAELFFGLSPDEVSPVSNFLVAPNQEIEVPVPELGDLGYHYLNVTNKDSVKSGKFSVKIL